MINQPVRMAGAPPIDNLYLDMNGIIHNCTHGNEEEVKTFGDEEEMVLKMFKYIDKLFQIAKPQGVFFMAIDGSAPRAKMNQQRSRRFRSAKDRLELEAQARQRGEDVPEDVFDSNCITPGTPFMQNLTEHLKFFIRKKIAEDPAWQKPQVVLSGHEIPGEGEHKIMEFIRWAKKKPDYKPNTRHCMYGLDADLVMLSLVSHEPQFCLLREVVSYDKGNKGKPPRDVLSNPQANHFMILQIGLLREYLDFEFGSVTLPFKYNLENIIDDFILICMLVGNDFLPCLPTLDINEGGLNDLLAEYRRMLPSLGGYINESGQLHLARFEKLLQTIAVIEEDVLVKRAHDAKDYDDQKARRERRDNRARGLAPVKHTEQDADGFTSVTTRLQPAPPAAEEGATMMGKAARDLILSGDPRLGLQAWKQRYYSVKLECADAAAKRAVSRHYIEGVQWVLEYYYRGVISWVWYYPHHYSPMASELTNLPEFDGMTFERGRPFLPYQQLLGVLPTASAKLLPAAYRKLMTDPTSPLKAPIDYYPEDFALDKEGKRQDWEAVILIPFMDENAVLRAEKLVDPNLLTPAERVRNREGEVLAFWYDETSTETSFCQTTLPQFMGSVTAAKGRMLPTPPPPPLPDGVLGFEPKLVKGTKLGALSPVGFPTLKTLKATARLAPIGVNVFGMTSRRDSVVLAFQDMEDGAMTPQQVAPVILGERCFVRWPWLQEAVVTGVSDATGVVTSKGFAPFTVAELDGWHHAKRLVANHLVSKQGIEVGNSPIMVHVRACEGMLKLADGSVEKQFSKDEQVLPLQAIVRRNPRPDPRLQDRAAPADGGASAFPKGTQAVYLGRAYFGCLVTVVATSASKLDTAPSAALAGKLRLLVDPPAPTEVSISSAGKRLLENIRERYEPSGAIARKVGLNPRVLGTIVGTVQVETGGGARIEVGLAIKSNSSNLVVPDYCRPAPENKGFLYSERTVALLKLYMARFPWVIQALTADPSRRRWHAADLLPGMEEQAAANQLIEVKKWLKQQPLAKRPLVPGDSRVASEAAIRALQMAAPPGPTKPPAPVELENVAPALLLQPVDLDESNLKLDVKFRLGDRVASVAAFPGAPPFGLRGIVVGVHEDGAVEVLFDRDFEGGSTLHGRITGAQGAVLPVSALLCITRPFNVAKGAAKDVAKAFQKAAQPSANKPAAWQPVVTTAAPAAAPAPDPEPKKKAPKKKKAAGNGHHHAPPAPVVPTTAPVQLNAGKNLLAMLQGGAATAGHGGAAKPAKVLSVEELGRGQGVGQGVGPTPAANADSHRTKTLEQAFWDSLVSKK